MRKLVIARDDAGQRLDRFLRKCLPSAPLGLLFKAVRTGRVRVNGLKARPEQRLEERDQVSLDLADDVLLDLDRPARSRPDAKRERSAAALRVLHRDEHVLAVDKPPFLLVQAGQGRGEATLEELVIDLVGAGASRTFRPALAHRLDRDTSGVVMIGLTAEGLRGLTERFRRREVTKRYLALAAGDPPEEEFRVDLPLARDPSDDTRGARVKVSRGESAQRAVTEFRVLGRSEDRRFVLLEARPVTGRTHQIRAHLRAVGLPIVGDPTYGDPRRDREWRKGSGIRRQFLHAWRVEMRHPVFEDRELRIESPLPDDLARTLRWAGLAPPA